ncbi:hypothetical protein [Paraburkholderia sp. GAS42]|jgi:hypothetical protein|uniref:hypothetical protein n=1 Tax=Paraburkholderia sp. GAS42 TaxID=3035135 RepID=UPI003D1CA397
MLTELSHHDVQKNKHFYVRNRLCVSAHTPLRMREKNEKVNARLLAATPHHPASFVPCCIRLNISWHSKGISMTPNDQTKTEYGAPPETASTRNRYASFGRPRPSAARPGKPRDGRDSGAFRDRRQTPARIPTVRRRNALIYVVCAVAMMLGVVVKSAFDRLSMPDLNMASLTTTMEAPFKLAFNEPHIAPPVAVPRKTSALKQPIPPTPAIRKDGASADAVRKTPVRKDSLVTDTVHHTNSCHTSSRRHGCQNAGASDAKRRPQAKPAASRAAPAHAPRQATREPATVASRSTYPEEEYVPPAVPHKPAPEANEVEIVHSHH